MMGISKTIDGIFIATRYGVFGLSVLGILMSFILILFNMNSGLGAIMTLIATLAISSSAALLLAPESLLNDRISVARRYAIAGVLAVIALIIMGVTYFLMGGFPDLNLLFI